MCLSLTAREGVACHDNSLWKQFKGLDHRVPSLAPDDYGKDAMRYEGTVSLDSRFQIRFWTWTERVSGHRPAETCMECSFCSYKLFFVSTSQVVFTNMFNAMELHVSKEHPKESKEKST